MAAATYDTPLVWYVQPMVPDLQETEIASCDISARMHEAISSCIHAVNVGHHDVCPMQQICMLMHMQFTDPCLMSSWQGGNEVL